MSTLGSTLLVAFVLVVGSGCSKNHSAGTPVDAASEMNSDIGGRDSRGGSNGDTVVVEDTVDSVSVDSLTESDWRTDSDCSTGACGDSDDDSMGDTGIDTGSDSDTDVDVDTDTDMDTDTDTDIDTDTDSDADTETETAVTTDTDSEYGSEVDSETDTDTEPAEEMVVDADVKYQVMEGFGASDAWNVDFVGKYWTDDQKESIARLLFSTDLDTNGNPDGIGLSRWRFNVGGGSAEQGAGSGIEEDTRRAECFLNSNGTYDWSKQSGQQWFLNKASEYGVEKFIMFSNSPPVHYTRNGLAYGDDGNNTNLASDKFDDFAEFLTTVLAHFEAEGIHFEEVSPVNEPQWDWTGGQEGSTWTNDEITRLVDSLNSALVNGGLLTDIMIPESGHYDEMHKNTGNAEKSDYMWNFFDSSRPTFVGDNERVPSAICGHSYWTFDNDTQLSGVRTDLRNEAEWFALKVLQTEYSMLSIPEELGDIPSYFDIALFMAKVIYADISIAHTVSWSFWTSLDRDRWGHMNRFLLIQLIPPSAPDGPLQESGTHVPHKTLWVLGNYSLFIRPGYQRIGLSGVDDLAGLMGTAYQSPDGTSVVVVFVNMRRSSQKITVKYDNLPTGKTVRDAVVYVTDEDKDLEKACVLSPGGSYRIPPRSVVTMKATLVDK